MRSEIVKLFRREVLPRLGGAPLVALVGGSRYDPELAELPDDSLVDIYGIDNALDDERFRQLDLNLLDTQLTADYDLVISSQVLEHLWDVKTGIHNLCSLVRPGGLLWLGCPASNFAHGSPEYFSAGYAPDLLARLVSEHGLDVLEAGCVGSKRAYIWTHAFHHWPTDDELAHPVRAPFAAAFRTNGPLWKRGARAIASLKSSSLLLADPTTSTTIDYATETWILARRSEGAATA